MTQGILPIKYEAEKETTEVTGLGGLPLYLDLAQVIGIKESILKNIGIRRNTDGYSDSHIITTLVLLNIAGGESVEDLKILESDSGFCRILREAVLFGLTRKEKKIYKKFLKKNSNRIIPSASTVFRYLSSFHDNEQEEKREKGKAFIPQSNKYLSGLSKVNRDLLSFMQRQNINPVATLDMDATLVASYKSSALYCYKGYKSYQPLNTWWAEQEMIVHTEFRDGNVPAGYEQLRVLKEALLCLPSGVKTVRLRSDTAGYQHDLLRYCDQKEDNEYGKIEFAIGCNVTYEFKRSVSAVSESDWQPLYKLVEGKKIKTNTEWAEVCFVPNAIGHSKKGPEYRYIAKRTAITRQASLPGMEVDEQLPFPTMDIKNIYYKIFGVVTNMDWGGNTLLNWHHERCGKSEEAHSVMKEDLAGGKLPSKYFGENAAWWLIMILSMNLNSTMKNIVLKDSWVTKRIKAIRFSLINIPARILKKSRGIFIRIKRNHPMFNKIFEIRSRIQQLIPAPG